MPLLRVIGSTTVLLGFCLPHLLVAQNISGLFTLYQNKQFKTLQERSMELSAQFPDNAEIRFFNALFLEDGEEAVRVYEHLFPGAVGKLREELAEKLSEYYYALGLYLRADDYEKIRQVESSLNLNSPEKLLPAAPGNPPRRETKKINFSIQVGAFGQEENARQLKKSLHTNQIESRIITRLVNGKNLYCVWVDGGNTLDETLRIADTIKERFQLEYRILEN